MEEKKKDFTTIFAILLLLTVFNLFFLSKYQKKDSNNQPKPAQSDLAMPAATQVPRRSAAADFYLENEAIKVGISRQGGQIISCQLKKYHHADVLAVQAGKKEVFQSNGLLVNLPMEVISSPPVFRVEKLTSNEARLRYQGRGIRIAKTYILPANSYLLEENLEVAPAAKQQLLILHPFFEELRQGEAAAQLQALYFSAGKKSRFKSSGTAGQVSSPQWLGLASKYFVVAAVPPPAVEAISSLETTPEQTRFLVWAGAAAGPAVFHYYLGPKEYQILKAAGWQLEKSMELGWVILEPLSLLMLNVLNFLYAGVKNYGLAIIILTIIIKIVLWPLTAQSFRSMQKMQKVQPHLKKLQEKHKGEPDKLQKEMMQLYKEFGVNPFGGCLPSLLQLPIFFALFATLSNAIELRGASFLWIRDLARPDTIFNLGPVPINILPILMAATMYWQQAQMPSTSDQTKMLVLMPLLMLVLFYGFPSGLVLYWFVFNLLTIAHQQLIIGKEKVK